MGSSFLFDGYFFGEKGLLGNLVRNKLWSFGQVGIWVDLENSETIWGEGYGIGRNREDLRWELFNF